VQAFNLVSRSDDWQSFHGSEAIGFGSAGMLVVDGVSDGFGGATGELSLEASIAKNRSCPRPFWSKLAAHTKPALPATLYTGKPTRTDLWKSLKKSTKIPFRGLFPAAIRSWLALSTSSSSATVPHDAMTPFENIGSAPWGILI